MLRDFTYVDDIVKGLNKIIDKGPQNKSEWNGKNPDPASSKGPFSIYNIGNNKPVKLLDFIDALEETLGKKAIKEFLPMQPGDVPATYADVTGLINDYDYKPNTDVRKGIQNFVHWYRRFYSV